jgi:hypothetical protein
MIEVKIKTLINKPEDFKKCMYCDSPNLITSEECTTCKHDKFDEWSKEDGIELSNNLNIYATMMI